jgi:hypothetical protein
MPIRSRARSTDAPETAGTPATGIPAPAIRVLGSTWLLGIVVALLSWPLRSVSPGAGVDPSWQTALHFAAEHRLAFGTELVFTYGPLGFLKVPLIAYDGPAVASAIYSLGVQLALGVTLVWAARRSFSLPAALSIAFVAASLMSALFIPTEAIISVAFIWCVVALGDDAPPFSWSLVVIGGAVLSAIEVLGKLNTGLLVLAMCTVAVLGLRGQRPRGLRVFSATFVAALAILWVASGQGLGNVDEYVSTGVEVISGYSRAVPIDAAAVGWDYVAAAGMIAAALGATFVGTRKLPPARRVATLVLVLLLSFALFKQAFVRHYAFFLPLFVSAMLSPWLAFRWTGATRIVAVAAIAVISILYFPISQGELRASAVVDTIQPVDRGRAAVDRLRTLLVPGTRERAREEAKARLRGLYGLDPRSLALLERRRVALQRSEFSLAWAYDLEWDPLPVLGAYSTYTPNLDSRNAEALASDAGPQRILRHRPGVETGDPSRLFGARSSGAEDRFAPWEGPRTTLAMLCHFEALRTTRLYQVLGRVPDRCGQPRRIGSVSTRYDRDVRVPRAPQADQVVFARVGGVEPGGVELIRTLLYRAGLRWVLFDRKSRYRVFPDTQEDLILSAPEQADFPRPFALAPNPRTIEFEREDAIGVSGDDLTIDFFALPIRS